MYKKRAQELREQADIDYQNMSEEEKNEIIARKQIRLDKKQIRLDKKHLAALKKVSVNVCNLLGLILRQKLMECFKRFLTIEILIYQFWNVWRSFRA